MLTLLRKPFDVAAKTLREALAVVDIPNDPQDVHEHRNPGGVGRLAEGETRGRHTGQGRRASRGMLGPGGAFPIVPDPRATDPGLEAGWLDARAVMCTSGDLLSACAQFQRPSPAADVRTSPWLRVNPHLHTVASAAERLRLWAESEWQAGGAAPYPASCAPTAASSRTCGATRSPLRTEQTVSTWGRRGLSRGVRLESSHATAVRASWGIPAVPTTPRDDTSSRCRARRRPRGTRRRQSSKRLPSLSFRESERHRIAR